MKKINNRIFATILSIMLLFATIPLNVFAEKYQNYNSINETRKLDSDVDLEFEGKTGLSMDKVVEFSTSGGTITFILTMGKISGDDTEFTVAINKDGKYYSSFSTENLRVRAKKIYLEPGSYTVHLLAQDSDNVYYAYHGMIYN